jgi:uncharacterized protein (TIGR02246 family)
MDSPPSVTTTAGQVSDAFVSAWNTHDMTAFAALFHEDAEFVNVAGMYARGRDQIEQMHAFVHSGVFRNSEIRFRLEGARELAPGIIVAHIASELHGDEREPGQTRRAMMTVVLQHRTGMWKIAAAHNTNLIPSVIPPLGHSRQ